MHKAIICDLTGQGTVPAQLHRARARQSSRQRRSSARVDAQVPVSASNHAALNFVPLRMLLMRCWLSIKTAPRHPTWLLCSCINTAPTKRCGRRRRLCPAPSSAAGPGRAGGSSSARNTQPRRSQPWQRKTGRTPTLAATTHSLLRRLTYGHGGCGGDCVVSVAMFNTGSGCRCLA